MLRSARGRGGGSRVKTKRVEGVPAYTGALCGPGSNKDLWMSRALLGEGFPRARRGDCSSIDMNAKQQQTTFDWADNVFASRVDNNRPDAVARNMHPPQHLVQAPVGYGRYSVLHAPVC